MTIWWNSIVLVVVIDLCIDVILLIYKQFGLVSTFQKDIILNVLNTKHHGMASQIVVLLESSKDMVQRLLTILLPIRSFPYSCLHNLRERFVGSIFFLFW